MSVESPNTLYIDFASSPEMKDACSNLEVGDIGEATIRFQVTRKTSDGMLTALEKWTTKTSGNDDDEKEAEPQVNQPIAMQVLGKKGKNKSGPYGAAPGVGNMME